MLHTNPQTLYNDIFKNNPKLTKIFPYDPMLHTTYRDFARNMLYNPTEFNQFLKSMRKVVLPKSNPSFNLNNTLALLTNFDTRMLFIQQLLKRNESVSKANSRGTIYRCLENYMLSHALPFNNIGFVDFRNYFDRLTRQKENLHAILLKERNSLRDNIRNHGKNSFYWSFASKEITLEKIAVLNKALNKLKWISNEKELLQLSEDLSKNNTINTHRIAGPHFFQPKTCSKIKNFHHKLLASMQKKRSVELANN